MILIKITKENREPEVGEWYSLGKQFSVRSGMVKISYNTCKTLSLSVILDAPETHGGFKNTHWIDDISLYEPYPISNSEEIFQWLYDQGELGDEWVEWPSPFGATWNGNPENGVFLFKTPYDLKIDRSKPKDEPNPIHLLRKLADLQNGPPLERDRKEWEETMKEVYDCLEKYNL